MNELQQKKYARLFSILDRDKDGAVERSDYEAIARQVAKLRGVEDGSPEQAQIASRMSAYWDSLAKRADKDANGRVTLAEWSQSMSGGSDSMAQTRSQMVALAAAMLDRDGDGKITQADYQKLLEMVGHKQAEGEKFFERLDENGDGKIDVEELGALVDQFLFSGDPTAAGNWLLGPL